MSKPVLGNYHAGKGDGVHVDHGKMAASTIDSEISKLLHTFCIHVSLYI